MDKISGTARAERTKSVGVGEIRLHAEAHGSLPLLIPRGDICEHEHERGLRSVW